MGLSIRRTTSEPLLKAFFERIKPIRTQFDLIRVGGNGDGGYLVPNDFEGIKVCFSPGVSITSTFEDDLARRGIKSYMADYSVDGPPSANPLFDFEKLFLGAENNNVYITLDSWVAKKIQGDPGDMILQMDIEGGEYDVLFQTPSTLLRKFRIVVIEFHKLDGLLDQYGYKMVNQTFAKLLEDFEIVHIHPNNSDRIVRSLKYSIPPTMEFTFLRKDRVKQRSPLKEFPNKLDFTSKTSKPDFNLPPCWYNN